MRLFYKLSLAFMLLVPGWPEPSGPLDELRWKNRILVISAPSTENSAYSQQLKYTSQEQAEFKERDLVTIDLAQHPNSSICRSLGLDAATFNVLLIGKDGGVKLRSPNPVTPRELYELIDAMPMRQRERKQSGHPNR
jgi:hypothetical protein